ncbi:sterol desaturase family protein [Rosenbergiella collisarenosi]|uniref:sterol desaturase family protein n=1 Tax=Rosenbergiella collisarenosi TaxID=1544695 RepID=UPI001F501751|nr:sterol desaturase family protein [Rosenbergiella collisarenosi]
MHYITDHWLVAWFTLLFIIEFYFYKNNDSLSKKNKHWKVNFLNFLATKSIGYLIIVPLFILASKNSNDFIQHLSFWISIPLGVVILDLSGYIFHRISHEIEFFWRFHEIHHLDEILDVSTSLRVHFLEALFHAILNSLFIYAFGISQESIAVHALLSFLFATYHHSRFKIPVSIEEKLSLLFTTPGFHEPHHDIDIKNNQSNYAFIFPLWDHIFSTYHQDTFKKEWVFGLSYSNDVDAIKSLVKPLSKDAGK